MHIIETKISINIFTKINAPIICINNNRVLGVSASFLLQYRRPALEAQAPIVGRYLCGRGKLWRRDGYQWLYLYAITLASPEERPLPPSELFFHFYPTLSTSFYLTTCYLLSLLGWNLSYAVRSDKICLLSCLTK